MRDGDFSENFFLCVPLLFYFKTQITTHTHTHKFTLEPMVCNLWSIIWRRRLQSLILVLHCIFAIRITLIRIIIHPISINIVHKWWLTWDDMTLQKKNTHDNEDDVLCGPLQLFFHLKIFKRYQEWVVLIIVLLHTRTYKYTPRTKSKVIRTRRGKKGHEFVFICVGE